MNLRWHSLPSPVSMTLAGVVVLALSSASCSAPYTAECCDEIELEATDRVTLHGREYLERRVEVRGTGPQTEEHLSLVFAFEDGIRADNAAISVNHRCSVPLDGTAGEWTWNDEVSDLDFVRLSTSVVFPFEFDCSLVFESTLEHSAPQRDESEANPVGVSEIEWSACAGTYIETGRTDEYEILVSIEEVSR